MCSVMQHSTVRKRVSLCNKLFVCLDLVRNINDPEHPLTLEQLNVVQLEFIEVNDLESMATVYFTPTIPHCSMATLIGLSIRVRLLRALPSRFKVLLSIY